MKILKSTLPTKKKQLPKTSTIHPTNKFSSIYGPLNGWIMRRKRWLKEVMKNSKIVNQINWWIRKRIKNSRSSKSKLSFYHEFCIKLCLLISSVHSIFGIIQLYFALSQLKISSIFNNLITSLLEMLLLFRRL